MKGKSGQVAIIGRPNTGKSTLLNAIMEQKISITSPLPQTTRRTVRAIYSDKKGKIYFSDTPGVLGKVVDQIGKRVNVGALKESENAEVLVCLFDISRPKSEEDNKIIGLARKSKAKKILVYNKIDKAVESKDHLAEYNFLEEEFDKTIGVSALKGKNVKGLVNYIFELLPEREIEEGEDGLAIVTDSKKFIGEIVREKAYLYLRREVPYSTDVEVEKVVDKGKIIVVKAKVLTNQERYKRMIIGKDGHKIKQIGMHARKELELMSGRKVFLELTVAVDKHWMERY
ncbi:GTPase Era [Candidatus Shapirobacteria bacterium RBG_13_44_7]|uniref:GTPase Era n=1 Tax=Candidatus Shapirobacteria bacterium RBG_13_44_7 TaxID=1802149 RepID=A0A1F7SFX5_9BACT|nr:MAG: GTPase Era [Candidatus Shapirobacteria bacterium RBG_13_44_7]